MKSTPGTAAAPAGPRPAASGVRQRRKAARPQELLDAALSLFVEKGFAATRSEEVAARAGVSKGTLYLYFPSKEELFKAVVRHNLSALIAEGQDLADSHGGSSADLLRCLMDVWWERVGHTAASGIFKIVVSEARNFPDLAEFYVDEVVQPTRRLLHATIRRGVERGEFRDLPVDDVVHALIAPVLFVAMHKHSIGACGVPGAQFDVDSFMRTQSELVLHGLAGPAK